MLIQTQNIVNLALFLVHTALAKNSLLITTENFTKTETIAECVLKLSAEYFVDKIELRGSIVIININSYSSNTQRLLLQTIHGGIKYSVMVKDSSYPHANASHFPEKAKNYMLILGDKTELKRNILQLSNLPSWNPLAKAIVFYQLKEGEKGEEAAINFINELRTFKLLKSIVFIYNQVEDAIITYSWNPYSDSNCGGKCTSVYVLDICKHDVMVKVETQREMFPLDMKACPLIVEAVVAEPYVMYPTKKISQTTYGNVYQFEQGGEVNLVRTIREFTNMTLIMTMSDKKEDWGTIARNGTAEGAYNLLKHDVVDLVIGNIEVTRPLRKWFDPTVSYTQDEMTWCVPKAKQVVTWGNLLNIFQWSTWVATFACVLAMGFIFHLFYSRENRRSSKWPTYSILMAFGMLLGWGGKFKPKSVTFRILIFSWLCFSLNMIISYESFLRSFLTHPRYEKQISSETDLIQSGISFGGRAIYRYRIDNASWYLYSKYKSTTFAEGIRRTVLDRNFAVVSSRRQAEYANQKLGKGASLVYCFPERDNLYKYGVVLLCRKWFPMLQRFNSIIRSVTENGLIEKWNKELFIHRVKTEGMSMISSLNFQHMSGAFIFIIIMYVICIMIFIIEIIYGYFVKSKI